MADLRERLDCTEQRVTALIGDHRPRKRHVWWPWAGTMAYRAPRFFIVSQYLGPARRPEGCMKRLGGALGSGSEAVSPGGAGFRPWRRDFHARVTPGRWQGWQRSRLSSDWFQRAPSAPPWADPYRRTTCAAAPLPQGGATAAAGSAARTAAPVPLRPARRARLSRHPYGAGGRR